MPILAPVDRPCCVDDKEAEVDVAEEVDVVEADVIVGGGAPGVKGLVCKLGRSEACQRTCIAYASAEYDVYVYVYVSVDVRYVYVSVSVVVSIVAVGRDEIHQD